jgi:hypothetical protein
MVVVPLLYWELRRRRGREVTAIPVEPHVHVHAEAGV